MNKLYIAIGVLAVFIFILYFAGYKSLAVILLVGAAGAGYVYSDKIRNAGLGFGGLDSTNYEIDYTRSFIPQ